MPGIQIQSKFSIVEIKVIQWGDNAWKSLTGMISGICTDGDTLSFSEVSGAPNLVETTNMLVAFRKCGSIEGIRYWDVSSVEDMQAVFSLTKEFNSDLSQWDVSSVKNMSSMFDGALAFNSDISAWDTSSVESMENMFYGAELFDQDISGWNVDSVTECENFKEGASLLTDAHTPNFQNCTPNPAP